MHKLLLIGALAAPLLASDLESLRWMAGHWTGQIGKVQAEEYWIEPKGNLMLGVSRTAVGERVVAFEFLRVEQRADGIFYVAQPGGRAPTEFKLTRSGASLAVFENPKHDHPKVITYELDASGTLVATIEGDEGGKHKKEQFRFVRGAK